jgi:hypothetical protein
MLAAACGFIGRWTQESASQWYFIHFISHTCMMDLLGVLDMQIFNDRGETFSKSKADPR